MLNKRSLSIHVLTLTLLAFVGQAFAQPSQIRTIQDYNAALPFWGVSWAAGAGTVNGYYPTFYTGFAIRTEVPERLHIRLSRGNQTRATIVLDDQTLADYLFDLVKRYEFYKRITGAGAIPPVSDNGALPQLKFFNQIIESTEYGILPFVAKAKTENVAPEAIYAKALSVLQTLNPGRVFVLRIDLRAEFAKWKQQISGLLAGKGGPNALAANDELALVALNSLLWGRVNYTTKPDRDLLNRLVHTAELAVNGPEPEFVRAAVDLLFAATGTRFKFRVLGERGQWQPALQCPNVERCVLAYPEFTAIYPTGSAMSSTSDRFGNRINQFTTPGLWPFLSRGSRHDVDNIRGEPYYGWAPKLDYQESGNGFHNPAVRFGGVSADVKRALGIPSSHSTLWAVKRGGVSHGCSRLPLGHVWELRHLFPVENEKMTQVYYFGNNSQDFDVFDIDGDGDEEVMGVEYMISYNLKGTSGLARREGADLEVSHDRKLDFYRRLYGERDVFTVHGDTYLFENPTVSLPSYLDLRKAKVSVRRTMNGRFPLYEQAYEKDKVQFYTMNGISSLTTGGKAPYPKRIVRLMGRVKGCAPAADKEACGEAAFDREVQELLRGQ